MTARPVAALAVLAALTWPPAPAVAAPVPRDYLGVWSQDPGCASDTMRIVFTANAMEVRQDNEQRSLSDVDAKGASPREVELRATRIVFVRQPNAAPPEVGDILRVRREGDLLRVLAVTTQGKLVTLPPDSTVFHRCRG